MKTVGDTFLDKLGYLTSDDLFRFTHVHSALLLTLTTLITQNYRLKITTEDILFYALHLLTILTTTLEIL